MEPIENWTKPMQIEPKPLYPSHCKSNQPLVSNNEPLKITITNHPFDMSFWYDFDEKIPLKSCTSICEKKLHLTALRSLMKSFGRDFGTLDFPAALVFHDAVILWSATVLLKQHHVELFSAISSIFHSKQWWFSIFSVIFQVFIDFSRYSIVHSLHFISIYCNNLVPSSFLVLLLEISTKFLLKYLSSLLCWRSWIFCSFPDEVVSSFFSSNMKWAMALTTAFPTSPLM